jgi:radical SAM superfamily enzyme YgiQ (UPF0313 family)
MRIELISPGAEDSARLPPLALATLAALTPPEVELSFSDDHILPLALPEGLKEVDLVAISVLSKTAYRAYQIADAYRQRGVKVVLGGIHPTTLPEEASAHADAVVIGEAEANWPRLLVDYQTGRLQRFYRQSAPADLERTPIPRREIFKPYRFRYSPVDVVQTTRGCPYDCDFCTVHSLFGRQYRTRPLASVRAEIEGLHQLGLLFADDNVIGNIPHFRQLFSSLIPLKLRWIGEASLAGLDDEENLRLLERSGCKALFIGFESLSPELKRVGKTQNHPERYGEIISRLHDRGIIAYGAFMFGFDFDDPSVFERTVEFAIRSKLLLAQFALLTPYPGTRLYRRLKAEGRLLREKWWLEPNQEILAPHFRPRLMEPERLREGWKWAWREFYSFSSIWRRKALWSSLHSNLLYLPLNLMQRRFARHKICGEETRARAGREAAGKTLFPEGEAGDSGD